MFQILDQLYSIANRFHLPYKNGLQRPLFVFQEVVEDRLERVQQFRRTEWLLQEADGLTCVLPALCPICDTLRRDWLIAAARAADAEIDRESRFTFGVASRNGKWRISKFHGSA